MTEADSTRALLDLARILGWQSAHFRPARTSRGWATPVQGDGKGFPDCVLVRPPRLVIAELKAAGGRLRPEQQQWLSLLEGCGGVEVHVWRLPGDWAEVERVLR